MGRSCGEEIGVLSFKFYAEYVEEKQILRLTTPKLKDVWGPVRSG